MKIEQITNFLLKIVKHFWDNRTLKKAKVQYLSGHPQLSSSGEYKLLIKKNGFALRGSWWSGMFLSWSEIKRVRVDDKGSHVDMLSAAGGFMLLGPLGGLLGAANRKKQTILCVEYGNADNSRTILIATPKAHELAARMDTERYKHR